MELPEHLRSALVHLRDYDPEGIQSLLEYFCAVRAQEFHRQSSDCMARVPRSYELASDYAAKAQVYEGFLKELLGCK